MLLLGTYGRQKLSLCLMPTDQNYDSIDALLILTYKVGECDTCWARTRVLSRDRSSSSGRRPRALGESSHFHLFHKKSKCQMRKTICVPQLTVLIWLSKHLERTVTPEDILTVAFPFHDNAEVSRIGSSLKTV